MIRITWLSVPASYAHASLALPLLHQACENAAVAADWQHVRAGVHQDAASVAAELRQTAPDVIAATLYLFNRNRVLPILRRVSAMLPDCTIILGGPEFLGDNQAFLAAEPYVAAVVRGDGEVVLPGFLSTCKQREAWSALPGMCWRDHRGYHDNGMAHFPATTAAASADWPMPCRSRFFPWQQPFVQMESSRGCRHRCSYCTSSVTGSVRNKPLAQVYAELEMLRQGGVREMRMLDRTFNAEPQRALALLQWMRDRGQGMNFHLEIHPLHLPEALRQALQSMPPGRLHLELGVQTGGAAGLHAVRRDGQPQKVREALDFLCRCDNLQVHVDLLAGLPQVDFDQTIADLNMVTALAPAQIQLEILKILPGTALAGQAKAMAIVHAPDPPYEVLQTPCLSWQQIEQLRQISRLTDQFYNAPALRPAWREVVLAGAGTAAQQFFLARDKDLAPLSLQRRMRLLHEFAASELPAVALIVERLWMQHGLPPLQAPAPVQAYCAPLPTTAVLISGNAEARPDAKCWRSWLLVQNKQNYVFVYARAAGINAAAAIWQW